METMILIIRSNGRLLGYEKSKWSPDEWNRAMAMLAMRDLPTWVFGSREEITLTEPIYWTH